MRLDLARLKTLKSLSEKGADRSPDRHMGRTGVKIARGKLALTPQLGRLPKFLPYRTLAGASCTSLHAAPSTAYFLH